MFGKKHKIITFVFGLIVVLLCLEAGLFLLGKVYKYQAYAGRGEHKTQAKKTVLCIGDSFTFGNGAPDSFDYPTQLEKILKDNGFDVCVVNRGIVGATTTMVLENLERDIDESAPDGIVLLVGGTNEIDLAGLLDFLDKDSWSAEVLSFFGRLHTVRLVRSGIAALLEKRRREIVLEENNISDQREKMPQQKDSLFVKGLELYHNQQYSQALDVFVRSAFEDSENPLVFDLLFNCLSFQEERTDDVLNRLDVLASKMQDPYLLYRNLFLWHFSRAEYSRARRYVSDGIRRSPERKDYYNLALQFFRPGRAEVKKERQALLFEMEQLEEKVDFAGRYLALARRWMKQENEKKIFVRWICSDTEKILDICHSKNIPVMLQSYPNTFFLYDELLEISRSRGLPFVDQYSMFTSLDFNKRAEFFAPDGHCNGKGYEKMARNIFKQMLHSGWIGEEK